MRKVCSIININLKNNLQSLSLVIVYFGIALICTAVIGAVGIHSFIEPSVKSGSANPKALGYVIGLLGYYTSFIVTGISYSTLFSTPLMREKVRGSVESLLASSTGAKTVWIAKSIALFIPGLIMGIVFSLGLTEFINIFCLAPNYKLQLNPWITACTYAAIPVIYLSLSMLMNLVGLISRVMDAGVIGIIFVSGGTAVMINLSARNTIDAGSWPFFVVNIALAAAMFVLCIAFKNNLAAERVVLSCRK